MDVLVYAIPVFLALVGVEALIGRALARRGMGPLAAPSSSERARGRPLYRLSDAISSVGCGVLDQVVNASVGALFIALYVVIERRFGLLELRRSLVVWAALVLGHDLCYYLFHRASHRVNFLWGTHITHHQSEEYNLSVSLRQGTLATWVTFWFYLPLALIGFPVEMFLVVHGVYQVYQFFVHTRLVGRLGPLEWILATPSLHRVHHGRTPECLDKNYGGFLNVWDRLFGTFHREEGEPSYGITTGLRSWSPVWANLHYFGYLAAASARAPRAIDKLKVWLMPPEWRPAWLPEATPEPRYDARPPRAWIPYLLAQVAVAVVVTWLLLWAIEALGPFARYGLSGFVVFTLVTVSAFLDGRRWARAAEQARNGVAIALSVALGVVGAIPAAAAVAGAVAAALSLLACVWLSLAGRAESASAPW